MIRAVLIMALCLTAAAPVVADTVVPTRTIRANSILSASDLKLAAGNIPGTLIALNEAVGQEARVVLYADRPIRLADIGPPALIDRNAIVQLHFIQGTLRISTDARSLARAGLGDTVRVMNLNSKTIVTGIVGSDGAVHVGQLPKH